MKKFFATLALLGTSIVWSSAQDSGQKSDTIPTEDEPLVTPVKPPRVVGQAQSKEEFDAWVVIDQTADLDHKAALATEFLERFPESGLTPLAHQLLALFYQQQDEYEKFVSHGEKAISELPSAYVLLTELAVGYAERGKVVKALAIGQKGLDGSTAAEKPGQLTLMDWTRQKDRLKADGHYALGLANLHQSMKAGADKPQHLNESVAHLSQAIELEPGHERAYLRMGRAFIGLKKAEKALEASARAVAVEGLAAQIARQQLEQLYTFVHKKKEGIDDLIVQEKAYLAEKQAAKEAELKELQNQEMQQFILPTEPGTPEESTPQQQTPN